MAVNGVNSNKNYLDVINSDKKGKPGKVYNAVFSDKDNDNLSISDFFDMMILQLTNQDFMNPVDDTQYLSQMAQFATMQEMMDLCQYSKQNYVTSMLGKEVTIKKNIIGGETKNTVGIVEKIMLQDGDYKVYVDGTPYDLSKITQIAEPNSQKPDKPVSADTSGADSSNNIGETDENTDAEMSAASLLADG